jgi:AcrR family transcriptional regulator
MARPLEFDPDHALDAAIAVFSSHGYEGSSTAELLNRMGIARQSLYGAFGDKRRLFLKALERYNANSIAELAAALGSKANAVEALEAALLAFARPDGHTEAGCLGLGSIAEFGRSDTEINAINDASAKTLLQALASRIREGVAAGELTAIDADEAARYLLTVRAGLKMAARGGASFETLAATVRMALRGLGPGQDNRQDPITATL